MFIPHVERQISQSVRRTGVYNFLFSKSFEEQKHCPGDMARQRHSRYPKVPKHTHVASFCAASHPTLSPHYCHLALCIHTCVPPPGTKTRLKTKTKPTGAAYAQAREQDKQRKKAIRDQRRAAAEATRDEDAELAAQMKASARLNGEVGRLFGSRTPGCCSLGRLGVGGAYEFTYM